MIDRVLCFYQPLGCQFSQDSEKFLTMWKESWHAHGWKTTVLCVENSKNHPDYDRIMNELSTAKLCASKYDSACYNRLLAYCNYVLCHGPVVYADYDVINYNLTPQDVNSMPMNTQIASGRSLVKMNEHGAHDIMNSIMTHINQPNPELVNDMQVCLHYTKVFKRHLLVNDILTQYDECKSSKIVHYHEGWRKLPSDKRLNTESRFEFAKRFRSL